VILSASNREFTSVFKIEDLSLKNTLFKIKALDTAADLALRYIMFILHPKLNPWDPPKIPHETSRI